MTCIAAWIDEDRKKVYIGADTQCTGGMKHFLKDSKLMKKTIPNFNGGGNREIAVGFCGSPRVMQLLQTKLTFPDWKDGEDAKNYVIGLMDSIRKVLQDNGNLQKINEVENVRGGSCMIVAYQGRIFEVFSDLQVIETDLKYAATGSGRELAVGALAAFESYIPDLNIGALMCFPERSTRENSARLRVTWAINIAAKFDPYVGGRIDVEEVAL